MSLIVEPKNNKMIKLITGFINDCLLFRTDDREFKKIGIAMWVNIAICIAAIIYYESLIR